MTDSLLVAEVYGKQHGHVIRAIEELDCSKKFTESNFGLSEYRDGSGKRNKMYEMTRDGFAFLANGLDADEKSTIDIVDGTSGNPATFVISEAGLYRLIMKSRKPEA